MKYSIIIPVYNRPDEIDELLAGLARQRLHNFEVIVVEDGSKLRCDEVLTKYEDTMDLQYFYKENTGPGHSRNYGVKHAKGEYIIFLDSDCLVKEDYLLQVDSAIKKHAWDAFGGPDDAHDSFSDVQKAINYAMTSPFTTGGIRGGKKTLDNYQPRSFNMGIRKEVFDAVGGFRDMYISEDTDLSLRLHRANYKVGLIPEAAVFHKRRIDFRTFRRQVHKFGAARVILIKNYPESNKPVYYLPALFTLGSIALLILGFVGYPEAFYPIMALALLLLLGALALGNSVKISILGTFASFVQLSSYGSGFLKAYWKINILGRQPEKAFPEFYTR